MQSQWGGGYSHQIPNGKGGVVPPSSPNWIPPHQEGCGYPPVGKEGLPPTPSRKDGVPLIGKDGGAPQVWTQTQSENITFPHPSDAGG